MKYSIREFSVRKHELICCIYTNLKRGVSFYS